MMPPNFSTFDEEWEWSGEECNCISSNGHGCLAAAVAPPPADTWFYINDVQIQFLSIFKSYRNIAFSFIAFCSLLQCLAPSSSSFKLCELKRRYTSTANGIVNRFWDSETTRARLHARSYGATYMFGGGSVGIEWGNLCQWADASAYRVWQVARDWLIHILAYIVLPTSAITMKINVECKKHNIAVCLCVHARDAVRKRYTQDYTASECETRTIK